MQEQIVAAKTLRIIDDKIKDALEAEKILKSRIDKVCYTFEKCYAVGEYVVIIGVYVVIGCLKNFFHRYAPTKTFVVQ